MSQSKTGAIVHPLILWYSRPAQAWEEALPVGNGRLGAMDFGGAASERLQLNEDTLWSGGPRDGDNSAAPDYLPEVRRLIFAGEYEQADELVRKMQGPFNQSYPSAPSPSARRIPSTCVAIGWGTSRTTPSRCRAIG